MGKNYIPVVQYEYKSKHMQIYQFNDCFYFKLLLLEEKQKTAEMISSLPFQWGDHLYTSESDACRRSRAERIEI